MQILQIFYFPLILSTMIWLLIFFFHWLQTGKSVDDNCGEAQPMYNTCQLCCCYGVYLKVFFRILIIHLSKKIPSS